MSKAAVQRPYVPRSRKGRWSIWIPRWILGNGFGLLLTVFVFGVLPYLQIVAGGGKKNLLVRSVAALEAPPPPDTMLEEPPPPPDAQEEPPPEMQPQNLSLGDLEASLNPGGGTGAAILNNAIGTGAMQNAMASFSLGDMDQKPRATYQAAPKIPANLRNASGSVVVEFVVDVQGRVQNPRVTSSFNPLLNEPVIAAIKQWRFEPAQRGGKRVPAKTKQSIKFGK